jgi:predicted metal-dependent hydrolase
MWSTGRSEAALEAALPAPIEIRPMRTARRLRLRFDESTGIFKLTCPARMSRRAALSWALDQRDWVEAQLALSQPALPFVPGALIPIEGEETRIVWDEAQRRIVRLLPGELHCGGPEAGLARRVEAFLKRLALNIMRDEVAEFARAAGVEAASVSVGDPGTRWGSCSSTGRIRLSWRLILAPPDVRRYVVAHEVAHLKHLNHGPQFKALEAQLIGHGLAEAKTKLRRVGPVIRRVGRGR